MYVSLAMVVVFSVLADSGDEAEKKEKKALAGGWTVVSAERDGEAIIEEEARKIRLQFGDEKLTLKQSEKSKDLLYRLEPDVNPRVIKLTATEGPLKDKPVQGIYAINGNELKLCFPLKADVARPEKFATSSGSGLMLLILKRDKQ
jgi:uncharacterized protein (TIGR03067 family)